MKTPDANIIADMASGTIELTAPKIGARACIRGDWTLVLAMRNSLRAKRAKSHRERHKIIDQTVEQQTRSGLINESERAGP